MSTSGPWADAARSSDVTASKSCEARRLGLAGLGRRASAPRAGAASSGMQPGQARARLGAQRADGRADVALGGQAAQDPHPRPVRRAPRRPPTRVPTATSAPARDRLAADLVGERGLADARIAGDHEQRRRARPARASSPLRSSASSRSRPTRLPAVI